MRTLVLRQGARLWLKRGSTPTALARNVCQRENPLTLASQMREIKSMVQDTKQDTVVLESDNVDHNKQTVTNEEDDSTEAWEERLKQALQQHESTLLETDKAAWRDSLEKVRDCYVHLGYWDKALQKEEQLFPILDTPRDQADCFHRMGSLHLQLQHFDKARTMYQRALNLFYDMHGEDTFHADMGKLLIGLGGIHVHSGNPEQALPLLSQAEQHYRHHGASRSDTELPEKPHSQLTTVLANQAIVHRMLGQHQVAIEKFHEIKALHENDEEKKDEIQFQIADCLFTLNQLSPALDHFETLLDREIQRRGNGESAHEGVLRHFIGIIHSKQGRMDEALRELESAYVIKKKTMGELHPEVASSLNGLGAVHASLGNDGEALSYFRESLMIARIHAVGSDEEDPQVMQTLRNISLVHGDKVPKWK